MGARTLQRIVHNGAGLTEELEADPRATIVITGKRKSSNASAVIQFTLLPINQATEDDWFDVDSDLQQDDFYDVSLQAGVRGVRIKISEGNWIFIIAQVLNKNQTVRGLQ